MRFLDNATRLARDTWKQDRTRLIMLPVLLLAAILRVGWPGIAEFKYDEAMISRRAIGLAQQGVWPASTISSIPGIPQPPVKALLLAIPYAFTRNPMAAVAFQGGLAVMTVLLTYLMGARYFGRRAGLLAATLLASAPWAIFYDRKLWSQNIPFFTVLMMFGLFWFVVEGKKKAIVLSFAALGLLIGFYLGNAILGVIVMGALVLFPRGWLPGQGENRTARDQKAKLSRWRALGWIVLGFAVLALTLIPYALELNGRAAASTAAEQAVAENTAKAFDPLGQLKMAATVTTGYEFHALAGDKMDEFYGSLPLPNLNDIIDGTAVWIICAGMVYVCARALVMGVAERRRKDGEPRPSRSLACYGLLALWIAAPVAAWTAFRQPPYPHRYIMSYPSQALGAAVMIDDLWRWICSVKPKWNGIVRGAVIALMGLVVVWQVVVYLGMLQFVSHVNTNGGHGQPVEWLWDAATRARELSGPAHLPVVIHTRGDDPEHQGGAAEFDAVLGDLPITLISRRGMEVYPPTASVWVDDQGGGVYVVELRPAPKPERSPGLARLDNGIDLVRVETPKTDALANGQEVSFKLTWRVWHPATGGYDYGYTLQLYDSEGTPLGQVDEPFLRSPFWQLDDIITTAPGVQVRGAMTGKPIRAVVAMYAYLSDSKIGPVNVLDVAGNPAGQQVSISLQ